MKTILGTNRNMYNILISSIQQNCSNGTVLCLVTHTYTHTHMYTHTHIFTCINMCAHTHKNMKEEAEINSSIYR